MNYDLFINKIELSKGKYALIDTEDFNFLNQWHWTFDGRYASRMFYKDGIAKKTYMHKLLMDKDSELDVDHINRNKLDNRRDNLRLCTRVTNIRNRGRTKANTSGVTGVVWHKTANKWMAQIKTPKKYHYLGLFKNKLEAITARNNAEKEFWS